MKDEKAFQIPLQAAAAVESAWTGDWRMALVWAAYAVAGVVLAGRG